MIRKLLFVLLLGTTVVLADDAPETRPEKNEDKKQGANLGMSILGNQEAPKALVIVPWKSSALGASPGVSTLLDDSRQPVDKEVFMRSLGYYEIRSEATHRHGGPAADRRNAPAETAAAHRRKS